MDVQPNSALDSSNNFSPAPGSASSRDAILVEELLNEDALDLSPVKRKRALSLTAKEIVSKINELLKLQLPEGVESLSAEETTPEATAKRIVDGVTGFYDVFAKQNPTLKDDELLDAFMSEIRGGVDQGYSDAYETLDGLGAFEFNGVREGVEKTRSLIDELLQKFEDEKRASFTSSPSVETAATVNANILVSAQSTLNLSA